MSQDDEGRLSYSGEDLYGQLIQSLVGKPLSENSVLIKGMTQQGLRRFFRILFGRRQAFLIARKLLEYGLDFLIGVPALRLVLED